MAECLCKGSSKLEENKVGFEGFVISMNGVFEVDEVTICPFPLKGCEIK